LGSKKYGALRHSARETVEKQGLKMMDCDHRGSPSALLPDCDLLFKNASTHDEKEKKKMACDIYGNYSFLPGQSEVMHAKNLHFSI
jgi:hypothetical protein